VKAGDKNARGCKGRRRACEGKLVEGRETAKRGLREKKRKINPISSKIRRRQRNIEEKAKEINPIRKVERIIAKEGRKRKPKRKQ